MCDRNTLLLEFQQIKRICQKDGVTFDESAIFHLLEDYHANHPYSDRIVNDVLFKIYEEHYSIKLKDSAKSNKATEKEVPTSKNPANNEIPSAGRHPDASTEMPGTSKDSASREMPSGSRDSTNSPESPPDAQDLYRKKEDIDFRLAYEHHRLYIDALTVQELIPWANAADLMVHLRMYSDSPLKRQRTLWDFMKISSHLSEEEDDSSAQSSASSSARNFCKTELLSQKNFQTYQNSNVPLEKRDLETCKILADLHNDAALDLVNRSTKSPEDIDKDLMQDARSIHKMVPWTDFDNIFKSLKTISSVPLRKEIILWDLIKQMKNEQQNTYQR